MISMELYAAAAVVEGEVVGGADERRTTRCYRDTGARRRRTGAEVSLHREQRR
jgi:hypothetical protein